MRLGTAWFVIILVLLSICVVQGFCPSSRLVSRAAVRRGTFPALADGAEDGSDFDLDDVFDAVVTDPTDKLKVRQASLENKMMVGFKQFVKDGKATNERLNGIETGISGINERLNAMQNATNERFNGVETQISGINGRLDGINGRLDAMRKAQMLVATALAAWMMLAPKLLEVVLASVPHATQ